MAISKQRMELLAVKARGDKREEEIVLEEVCELCGCKFGRHMYINAECPPKEEWPTENLRQEIYRINDLIRSREGG